MTPLRNGDRSANYHLTLSGEAGIDREIYGRVSGASGSIWWGWPIEEVSFLSCINNS